MPERIRSLQLTAFRGATGTTRIAFDATKPLVLLFGENGAGKSTVVDAIDAVCNRRAGSLAERSSTSVRDHLPSAGRPAADLSVELSAGAGAWRATLAGNAISTTPPYDGAPVYVLRRGPLLELVNAQPAARYAAIQGFVDVGGVERAERTLGEAAKEAGDLARQTEGALAQARATLDDLWARDGRPGGAQEGAEAWAEAQVAADVTELAARAERAHALSGAAERLEAAGRAYAEARARAEAGRDAHGAAERAVAALGAGAYGAGLAAVLADVERLLAAADAPDACPVCERPADVPALRARVAARLADARALTEALAHSADAARQLEQVAQAEGAARLARAGAARALAGLMNPERLDDPGLRDHGVAARGAAVDDAVGEESVEASVEALVHAADAVRARAAAVGNRLQQQIGRLETLRVALAQVQAKTDELADARRAHARLAAAQAAVREERVAFVQRVLDEVAGECNRLYEAIHPGEGVRLGRLWLDAKRRGSLHQEAEFGAHGGVPPQAYFSESHLDTLGFCFWLAITKRAALASPGAAPPVVVLDDAFASTDLAHGRRILGVLAAESAGLAQVVVATHQRAWLDAVRAGAVPAAGAHVVELGGWSPERGIRAA